MKTYEARRRIGLKLKIKQEAGLTKVVHNTALDPVHTPPRPPEAPPPAAVPTVTSVIRTPPPPAACSAATSSSTAAATVNGTLDRHDDTRSPAPDLPPAAAENRRKSDSPDTDNASFSSGSPPADDSLNLHLQSAIDSILNLQQGGASRAPTPRTPPTPRHPLHLRPQTPLLVRLCLAVPAPAARGRWRTGAQRIHAVLESRCSNAPFSLQDQVWSSVAPWSGHHTDSSSLLAHPGPSARIRLPVLLPVHFHRDGNAFPLALRFLFLPAGGSAAPPQTRLHLTSFTRHKSNLWQ
ncbi:hypothetical protein AAFF_G00277140 [Aldrovandia affinis]|uniref:Uncharacterized protein n=1 Tax=Aldrovandia affinis TaxID=143900 RepID=A0AAD7RAA4_9TELE|nr:hypothetical protein AAFF_G00277140 [Aldrovandia affinis]